MELNKKIVMKFLELKCKYPDWSFYRVKLLLKKEMNLNIKQINSIPFFAEKLVRFNKKVRNGGVVTGASEVTYKKLRQNHYDFNNIITKGLLSVGAVTQNAANKEPGIPVRFIHHSKKHWVYE